MPTLYPVPEPYATHMLPVGNGHTLYVDESGNPKGLPAIRLHGGPGSASKADHRANFNPKKYRIILFDQRACGQSQAKNPLRANTTGHLVEDIETIRKHLKIEAWHVVTGSSWGSTLALAYAQAHAKRVKNLALSAIFLADKEALQWFTHPHGAAQFFPQEYTDVMHLLGNPPPSRLFKDANRALHSWPTPKARKLAQAIMMQHCVTFDTPPQPDVWRQITGADPATSFRLAGIMVHYLAKNCFLTPNQLLANAGKIKHIPTSITHGELDLCCPPANAYKLHAALPKSTLTMVSACGHRANDAMDAARTAALDALAKA